MPSSDENDAPHSLPIPIGGPRARSGSMSMSDSSSDSGSPASPLPTPTLGALPRIMPVSPSTSPTSPTSPIFSFFNNNQSPNKTFPFRGMARSFFDEHPEHSDEDPFSDDTPLPRHTRRASTTNWGPDRFVGPTPVGPAPPEQQQRVDRLLRRLSLGGGNNPPVLKPIKSPVECNRSTSPAPGVPPRQSRRANTLGPGTPRPPRAPSPMGERILKGHFDGFN